MTFASAAERRRAKRLYAKVIGLLENSKARAHAGGDGRQLRLRAERLARIRELPPFKELIAWAKRFQVLVAKALGAASLVGLVTVVWCLRVPLGLSPNLARGLTFVTSSTLASAAGPFLFHTDLEPAPTATLDLDRPVRFSALRIVNRPDCCQMRAIPLIVEISNDNTTWTPLLTQETVFQTLTRRFPSVRARYVRFRVGRSSYLHLAGIGIYR